MHFICRSALLLLIGLASLNLQGCGGGSDKFKQARPKTYPAVAVVTYKGAPVIGATVVLAPVDGKHAAAGMTDSSGTVILKAFPPEEGAVPGTYNASVSLLEQVSMPVLPDGVHEEDVKLPKPKSLIPEKFAKPETSGLQVIIPDGGSQEITVELVD